MEPAQRSNGAAERVWGTSENLGERGRQTSPQCAAEATRGKATSTPPGRRYCRKEGLEFVKVEQVEVGPGCVYTWQTYRPWAKKLEGAEVGGCNLGERESYVELEIRE